MKEYIEKQELEAKLNTMYAKMSENDYEELKNNAHNPYENIMVSTMLVIAEDMSTVTKEEIERQAVKEFANRLKNEYKNSFSIRQIEKDTLYYTIDELLKEMGCDDE